MNAFNLSALLQEGDRLEELIATDYVVGNLNTIGCIQSNKIAETPTRF